MTEENSSKMMNMILEKRISLEYGLLRTILGMNYSQKGFGTSCYEYYTQRIVYQRWKKQLR